MNEISDMKHTVSGLAQRKPMFRYLLSSSFFRKGKWRLLRSYGIFSSYPVNGIKGLGFGFWLSDSRASRKCQWCPQFRDLALHCAASAKSCVPSSVQGRPTIALSSQSSQVSSQRRRITQFPVSFSSSSFILNDSRLLGISVSGVPVFVRSADSYQESEQNSPWEKSSFPDIWQVETFHAECTPL